MVKVVKEIQKLEQAIEQNIQYNFKKFDLKIFEENIKTNSEKNHSFIKIDVSKIKLRINIMEKPGKYISGSITSNGYYTPDNSNKR